MNVCIIGDGLTSLSLAKNLINKKINVDIYCRRKNNNLSLKRTLGISKSNFDFFNKEIIKIEKKNFWEIKEIEIFSEKLKINKILNFTHKKNIFFMLKNEELNKLLFKQLSKSKYFKNKSVKNDEFYKRLIEDKKYELIINCDSNNFIAKKYFSKKIKKSYNNFAYTTILHHNELENHSAIQIFTRFGPIAFLPISSKKTSVVYSLDIKDNKLNTKEILDLIVKYNPKFIINKIDKIYKFELKSSNLRNYYYKNIVAFGDCLHKIHPLAGQGFNMTIRDIKVMSKIIQDKLDLGIQLDDSIFKEFEKKNKHLNFIFSNGINFIHEFFNFGKKSKNEKINRLLKFVGNNKFINNIIMKYADKGLIF